MHAVSQDEAYAAAMNWPNHRRILPLTHGMASYVSRYASRRMLSKVRMTA